MEEIKINYNQGITTPQIMIRGRENGREKRERNKNGGAESEKKNAYKEG